MKVQRERHSLRKRRCNRIRCPLDLIDTTTDILYLISQAGDLLTSTRIELTQLADLAHDADEAGGLHRVRVPARRPVDDTGRFCRWQSALRPCRKA